MDLNVAWAAAAFVRDQKLAPQGERFAYHDAIYKGGEVEERETRREPTRPRTRVTLTKFVLVCPEQTRPHVFSRSNI